MIKIYHTITLLGTIAFLIYNIMYSSVELYPWLYFLLTYVSFMFILITKILVVKSRQNIKRKKLRMRISSHLIKYGVDLKTDGHKFFVDLVIITLKSDSQAGKLLTHTSQCIARKNKSNPHYVMRELYKAQKEVKKSGMLRDYSISNIAVKVAEKIRGDLECR